MRSVLCLVLALVALPAFGAAPPITDGNVSRLELVSSPSPPECGERPFQPVTHNPYTECVAACDAGLVACTNACHSGPPSNGRMCFVLCTDQWHDCWIACDPFL
jgi:hypothetical protein